MRDEWILDVLADLRTFADTNDLPLLAEQLDDTALIATAELVARTEGPAGRSYGGEKYTGTDAGGFGPRGLS